MKIHARPTRLILLSNNYHDYYNFLRENGEFFILWLYQYCPGPNIGIRMFDPPQLYNCPTTQDINYYITYTDTKPDDICDNMSDSKISLTVNNTVDGNPVRKIVLYHNITDTEIGYANAKMTFTNKTDNIVFVMVKPNPDKEETWTPYYMPGMLTNYVMDFQNTLRPTLMWNYKPSCIDVAYRGVEFQSNPNPINVAVPNPNIEIKTSGCKGSQPATTPGILTLETGENQTQFYEYITIEPEDWNKATDLEFAHDQYVEIDNQTSVLLTIRYVTLRSTDKTGTYSYEFIEPMTNQKFQIVARLL